MDRPSLVVHIHDLAIHSTSRVVQVDQKMVSLTRTELRLLLLLANRPGHTFSRRDILDGLHGSRYAITDRAVDVQILGLRRKLGPAAKHIQTVRQIGYRMQAEPPSAPAT